MTEEQKERRRRQANAIRVQASPVHMPLEEFENRYKKRQFIASTKARNTVEASTQQMFCDECATEQDGGLSAHILHVTIEEDLLRNFWMLATLRCFGCGFEEVVPLEKPTFVPDDFNMLGVGGISPTPTYVNSSMVPGQIMRVPQVQPNPWIREFETQRQRYHNKMQAAQNMQAAQVQAAQAQLLKQAEQVKIESSRRYSAMEEPQKQQPPGDLEKAYLKKLNKLFGRE